MDILVAHQLAHFIQWQHAKERARFSRVRLSPEDAFDELAATCLGDLIHTVARTGKFSISNG